MKHIILIVSLLMGVTLGVQAQPYGGSRLKNRL